MSDSSATPWTAAHQDPLSMGFSRQEYRSAFPFPTPGDLPLNGCNCASLEDVVKMAWRYTLCEIGLPRCLVDLYIKVCAVQTAFPPEWSVYVHFCKGFQAGWSSELSGCFPTPPPPALDIWALLDHSFKSPEVDPAFHYIKRLLGNSLAVQWIGLHFCCRGPLFDPWSGN